MSHGSPNSGGQTPLCTFVSLWCTTTAFTTKVTKARSEAVRNRTVVPIALNLLEGAAVVQRAQRLRSFGVPVPAEAFDFRPRPLW